MADDAPDTTPQEDEQAPEKRRLPLKPVLIVAGLAAVQVGVAVLVIHLARKPEVKPPVVGPEAGGEDAPANTLTVVDLGTYNITQFTPGDPVNRRQLAVNLGVSVKRDDADEQRQAVVDQKVWIGQLLDEVIGSLPMDGIHVSNREPLKQQIRTRINQRLGDDVAQEVILRIQSYGA